MGQVKQISIEIENAQRELGIQINEFLHNYGKGFTTSLISGLEAEIKAKKHDLGIK